MCPFCTLTKVAQVSASEVLEQRPPDQTDTLSHSTNRDTDIVAHLILAALPAHLWNRDSENAEHLISNCHSCWFGTKGDHARKDNMKKARNASICCWILCKSFCQSHCSGDTIKKMADKTSQLAIEKESMQPSCQRHSCSIPFPKNHWQHRQTDMHQMTTQGVLKLPLGPACWALTLTCFECVSVCLSHRHGLGNNEVRVSSCCS